MDLIDLKVGVSSLSAWMAPYQLSVGLRVVLAAVVTIALAVYTVKKSRAGSSPSSPLWLLWAVYGISHLGILVLVMSVADAQTRLIPRQVAPVGLAVVVAALVRTPMTRIGLVLLSPLAVAAVALGVAGFADLADETGYGEEPWVSSDAFDAVRHSDADYVLSNSPEAIWMNTGLSTYAIPTATNPWTGLSNERLERELAKLRELMATKTIEVVLFDDMRSYLVDLQTLLDLGFVVGERFETATLLVEAAP